MSGEEKSELMRLVAEEVERQRKEGEEERKRKREEEAVKRKAEAEKRKAEAAAKKKAEEEEKKKAVEHRQRSIDGKKRKREERANEAQTTHWPSYGALRTTSAPSPSGFFSESSLSLPEGMPPLLAQEYVIANRSRQRELFNAWAPHANRLPMPEGLLPSLWNRWVLTTDPRFYPTIMAESSAAQYPPPAPFFNFSSAPQQQSYPPAPQHQQRGGRGGFGAGRSNPRFAGQSGRDIAAARKRQQALSNNRGGAPPPLTPSFNLSTGPAIEKQEKDEPAAKRKKRVRGKAGKGGKPVDKPVDKPTEEVAAQPAEDVAASGETKDEDRGMSLADIPLHPAEDRSREEMETLRSQNQALLLEVTRLENEAEQHRMELLQRHGQITTLEQRTIAQQQLINALELRMAAPARAQQQRTATSVSPVPVSSVSASPPLPPWLPFAFSAEDHVALAEAMNTPLPEIADESL